MRIPEEAIVAAADRFAREKGHPVDEFEASEIQRFGLDDCDLEQLATFLKQMIVEDDWSEEGFRASAYWALGKKYDAELLAFFRKQLAIEVQRDLGSTFQILIALDNLDEAVFSKSRNGQFSVLDEELNKLDAKAYLEASTSS